MAVTITEGWQQRFAGVARLYGNKALVQFACAHVCVIGIGGVGSWAAEALVRSGIGGITLIDMDDICISNTNRQIHAMQGCIGQPKTEVMAARLALINPGCRINIVDDFISSDNVAQLLTPSFSYVIDAIDSVRAKAALIVHCRRNKIPLITIGGAGGLRDATQIQIADLAKTIHDPLAARLRARLKHDYRLSKNSKGKFGVDCVFSREQPLYPQPDGSVCSRKHGADSALRLDCSAGFGAVTMITASFAFIAVSQVLKKILAKTPH